MESSQPDELKKLVWLTIGLAVLGIVIAALLYSLGVVPVHAPLNPPTNTWCPACPPPPPYV